METALINLYNHVNRFEKRYTTDMYGLKMVMKDAGVWVDGQKRKRYEKWDGESFETFVCLWTVFSDVADDKTYNYFRMTHDFHKMWNRVNELLDV